MQATLEELNKTPGIVGSFIVDSDGIVVTSDVPADADAETCAALVAALKSSADKSLSRLGSGELTTAFFEMEAQKVFLHATGVGSLVALAEPDANLGLVRMELRQAARRLDQSVGVS
jgi:predicted regulator of Ras-like GTPase activity (Roadblock/LC7/MglB family)